MDLLIGLDIGTSAVKGVLISTTGRTLASARRSVPFEYPLNGRVEIRPESHFDLVCALIRELAGQVTSTDRIRGLSMAVASGNSLLLDNHGRPLTPIISWLDQRAVNQTETILPELLVEDVHDTVGWPWIEMFPLAQLAWLKHYEPESYRRSRYRKMNLEYLLFRLSGRWVIDCSNATTSYLRNQNQRSWHEPYLEMLDIDRSTLSELLPAGTPLGTVHPACREATGLDESTLIVLGAFDHPCAARATGTLCAGQLLLSCGTSWAALYPLQQRKLAVGQGMLVDPFLEPDGPWAGIGALRSIGVNIEWCIDNLIAPRGHVGDVDKYTLFNTAAASSIAGAGGLYVNPLSDLSQDAGQVSRIEAAYSREQIARAVMEGAAFETRRLIEQYAAAGIPAVEIAMVGGPSESPIWPQIVADVTGLELKLVNGQNAGAVGAAALAGIGCGYYTDEQEAFAVLGGQGQIVAPREKTAAEYSDHYHEYRQIMD